MGSSARVTVVLDEELNEQFRKAIAERKGIGKGNLSEAISEAIELWIKEGDE